MIKNIEYYNIINDILNNKNFQTLKNFKHHYGYSRYQHSLSVSYYSYLVCKFLHLDYVSATRGALLHDLFFYDTNTSNKPSFHLWKHPKISLNNAHKFFDLNVKESDIILKHMWPITIIPPKYLESYVITIIDKYCALKEWINYSYNNFLLLHTKRDYN